MTEKDQNKPTLTAKIEALLFNYGEPIPLKKAAKILGIKNSDLKKGIEQLKSELEGQNRGLAIIETAAGIVMATKPELEKIIASIMKEELRESLTPAALEVLTIISYLGPISRLNIDFIRGVNSSFSIRNLFLRGLIERERKGHRILYRPSLAFLKHMGIVKIEDLPNYQQYQSLAQELELKTESQNYEQ